MKSSNIEHIAALDHLRLMAALLVFAFHVFHHVFGHWQPMPDIWAYGFITEGHTGVTLFFALSGFLFMRIGLEGEMRYADFIRNRFLRIFPLFVFFYFIAISVGRDDFRAADVLYLFFSNLGQAPTSNSFITGAAWTISVEFSFYLVLPFLVRFSREQGLGFLIRLLLLMALVKLGAYAVTARSTHMLYSTLVGRFDQFLWGMLAAMVLHQYGAALKQQARFAWPWIVFLLWGALAWQAHDASYFLAQPKQLFWLFWGSLEAALWSALIMLYVAAEVRWPTWLTKAMSQGGKWSYSLYLWHGLVIFTLGHYGLQWLPFDNVPFNFALTALWMLCASMAVAAVSYHTIEKPFLDLRRSYILRQR